MDLNQIQTPTLLLDKNKAIGNIEAMISKCNDQEKSLRPHFKTHQSIEVGRWFRRSGITKITVSSVDMAEYFAQDGWDDILIAFPFNPREISRINSLGKRIKLTLIVPCPESAKLLAEVSSTEFDVMIKIDTGYGRSGISWEDKNRIREIQEIIKSAKNLRVTGLLSHSGHTYKSRNIDEITNIYLETVERMNLCRDMTGRPDLIISVGDTPSASIINNFQSVDELRPGNFIFYDLMQFFIGSCKLKNISIALACPVVDIRGDRRKAVIYGGGVHLSKESLHQNGMPVYGMAVKLNENGWIPFDRDIYISSLSQEHGIVESDQALPSDFQIGELIGIIPVHSCLTANLAGAYTLVNGEVIDHMMAHCQ